MRRARTCHCDWTSAEDEAYQRLVEGSGSLGWFYSGMSFGQIQRARQAASCLPAAYASRNSSTTGDDAAELGDIQLEDVPGIANSQPRSIPA